MKESSDLTRTDVSFRNIVWNLASVIASTVVQRSLTVAICRYMQAKRLYDNDFESKWLSGGMCGVGVAPVVSRIREHSPGQLSPAEEPPPRIARRVVRESSLPEGNSVFSAVSGSSIRRRATSRLDRCGHGCGLGARGGTIAVAGPAFADDAPTSSSGVTATLEKTYIAVGDTVQIGGHNEGAGLFELKVDGGGSIKTYCIDLHHSTQPSTSYKEVPGAESSLVHNENAGKIRWILEHSYPQVSTRALNKTCRCHVDGGSGGSGHSGRHLALLGQR